MKSKVRTLQQEERQAARSGLFSASSRHHGSISPNSIISTGSAAQAEVAIGTGPVNRRWDS